MAHEWHIQLQQARRRLGVSQGELAARSHVSAASIKSYETGKRHPSRPYLVAILDALKLDREERNAILTAAGFASDGLALGPGAFKEFMFTPAEAAAEVETAPWPAFILNEMMQVTAANALCQRLWGVDFTTDRLDPVERNFLVVASDPAISDRIPNWDEPVRVICGTWRSHHRGAEDLESPSPYFNSLLQRFLQGDPGYVARFMKIWQTAEPHEPKIRWSYPIVWDEPGIGIMRFACYVTTANESDGLAFNDWIPTDATTWTNLARLASRD